MQASDAIGTIIRDSGKSVRLIGKELGRSPTYLSSILSRGSVPKADTLAAIADRCGYELVLRGHGQEIAIDPPEQGGTANN